MGHKDPNGAWRTPIGHGGPQWGMGHPMGHGDTTGTMVLGCLWDSLVFGGGIYGVPLDFLGSLGDLWGSIVFIRIPLDFMGSHWILWGSMGFYGVLLAFMGFR